MTEESVKDWMDSLFPKGKEVWVRIEVIDSEKCFMDAFRITNGSTTAEMEHKHGYKTTCISYADGINDQLSVLYGLKEQLEAEINKLKTKSITPE